MFLSQCGPPKWNIFPPRANPFRTLGKSQFHFQQNPAAVGESPQSHPPVLSKGKVLLAGLCVPCPCFLHSSLPTTEFLTLSGPAFFILLPFPALLLSDFEGLPQPRASCAVLDCPSVPVALVRSLCPRASVQFLLLPP